MGFLPGNHKKELQKMLIQAWNEIAIARNDPITYVSYNDGFEWIIATLFQQQNGEEKIQVALFSSEGHAREFRNSQINRGMRIIGISYPHQILIDDNLGIRYYSTWRDQLARA